MRICEKTLLQYQIFSRQQNRQPQMADEELMYVRALLFDFLLRVKLDRNEDMLRMIGYELNRIEEIERIEREKREEFDRRQEFEEYVRKIVGKDTIRDKFMNRLYMLKQLIASGETIEHIEKDNDNELNNSPLGFQLMRAKQPDFNNALRKMIKHEVWCNKDQKRTYLAPWIVYELLRWIGVSPVQSGGRTHSIHDPQEIDCMLYNVYRFDRSQMLKHRHRL